jgi:hypothetical protein
MPKKNRQHNGIWAHFYALHYYNKPNFKGMNLQFESAIYFFSSL